MPSTTTPTEELKPQEDPAILQEKGSEQRLRGSASLEPIDQSGFTTGTFRKSTVATEYGQKVGYGSSTSTSSERESEWTYKRTTATTPNFHKVVETGGILPVLPFTHRRTERRRNYRNSETVTTYDGKLVQTVTSYGPVYVGNVEAAAFARPSPAELAACDRRAQLKVRLELKNQKVNLAMIVAERNKTAMSLAKIVNTIATMVMELRKGNLYGAAKAAGKHVGYRKSRSYGREFARNSSQAAANAWLELQYAIKPLLMDVNGLVEALADFQYQKATGTASASSNLMILDDTTVNGQRRLLQGSVSIRYVVYFQVDFPEMPSITALGLTNPAQLAWEVIPFSFVVDWFLPIGDWLGSLDATVGMTFSDGARSEKRDLTLTHTSRTFDESISRNVSGVVTRSVTRTKDTSSFTENSLVRTKLDRFPGVTFPEFKNPASLMHLASSLALLRKLASK